jgi:hypothetical protein
MQFGIIRPPACLGPHPELATPFPRQQADATVTAASTTAVVATTTTLRWLPSCQLLASRVCAPTLLGVGVAAAEAAHAAAAAAGADAEAQEAALVALHEVTSKPGRCGKSGGGTIHHCPHVTTYS